MASYSNNVNICSGNKGGSAVASAAYQSAEKLRSDRDGEKRSYNRGERVQAEGIMKPDNAPEWCLDRQRLWNEVEQKEGNRGQYARRHKVALPRELTLEQQEKLLRQYIETEFVSRGMVADYAIHCDKNGNNPHAHIMTTMRPFKENGEWGAKSKTEIIRDKNGKAIVTGRDKKGRLRYKQRKIKSTNWDNPEILQSHRDTWEKLQNAALAEIGSNARVSAKSYKDRGIEKLATIHLGAAATAMEKRGEKSIRGDINRAIEKINKQLAAPDKLEAVASRLEGVLENARNTNVKKNTSQRRRGQRNRHLFSNERVAESVLMSNLLERRLDPPGAERREVADNQNVLPRVGRGSVEFGARQVREAAGSRGRLRPLRAYSGRRAGRIDIVDWAGLSLEEKHAVADVVPVRRLGVQQKEFCDNVVFARDTSGGVRLLPLNKKTAQSVGLKGRHTPRTLAAALNRLDKTALDKSLVRQTNDTCRAARRDSGKGGKILKMAGAAASGAKQTASAAALGGTRGAMASALNENTTREQLLKNGLQNVGAVFKTPLNVAKDILTNPLTAIFKAPLRIAQAFDNAMSAVVNVSAATVKPSKSEKQRSRSR